MACSGGTEYAFVAHNLRTLAPALRELERREQFRTRGGPEYAYRLRMAHPPPPDFRLQLGADVLTIPRGGQAKLKVQAERVGGHGEPIALTVEGTVPGIDDAAFQEAAETAKENCPVSKALAAVPEITLDARLR